MRICEFLAFFFGFLGWVGLLLDGKGGFCHLWGEGGANVLCVWVERCLCRLGGCCSIWTVRTRVLRR